MSRQVPPPREDRGTSGSRRNRALRSVRTQLLLTVGLVLIVGLAAILILDYRNEQAGRLRQKRVALQEEARILLSGVQRMASFGSQAVQDYIDDACARMQETTSPGHHIAVRLGGTFLQAHAHRRASPEMLQAMEMAADSPTSQGQVDGRPLLVGSVREADTEVFVSEYVSNVLAASRWHLLWQSTQLAALGLAAAAVTGIVLVRVVTRPIRRLVSTVRQIAEGERGAQVAPFGTAELQFLADEVNAMSGRLADDDAARRRTLDKARRIQENLLPTGAAPPGWRIASVFRPADAVGGDFFDFATTPAGRLVVCIADVTGHGVPAALGAAMLKVLFDAAVRESDDPGAVLASINRGFSAISLAEQFASVAVATIDADEGRLRWAGAGHEPAYRLRPGHDARPLTSTGSWIGIHATDQWETTEVDLRSGDRLILLTDGWAESHSESGEVLGRDRLRDWLVEAPDATPDDAVRWLVNRLSAWCGSAAQADDTTLLILEMEKEPADAQTDDAPSARNRTVSGDEEDRRTVARSVDDGCKCLR